MSLKAKLEAVIYAAEEPVTLAQLSALFASEALEWKAEQARLAGTTADESASLSVDAEGDGATSLLPNEFDDPGVEPVLLDSAPVESSADVSEPAPTAEPSSNAEVLPEPTPEAGSEATEPSPDSPAAAPDPEVEVKRLARLRDREVRATLRELLDELIADYASDNRGIEVREIAGGYRLATKPECHDAVRGFVKSLKPPLKLSLPALETLAVIAYKQPVTAPEVNEIRGVDSSGVFGSLLSRKLIATAGRKQVIGRPILYKTTREFLLRFGLKDVTELPSMDEFEKLAAIELDEPETPSGDETSTPTDPDLEQNLSLEFNRTALEESEETAVMADSLEPQPPVEVAPAAPLHTEQAETENSPHGEEIYQDHKDR
jgi:segregation and condensation protein B